MNLTPKLPRGIRNNNPGNLRGACWSKSRTRLNNGFATFDTMHEGLTNLACCVWQFYDHLKLNTVAAFVSRYAPASENDLLSYENFMAAWMGFRASDIGSRDLNLFHSANAQRWIGGIIRIENGVPPHSVTPRAEWCSAQEILAAMTESGHWGAP